MNPALTDVSTTPAPPAVPTLTPATNLAPPPPPRLAPGASTHNFHHGLSLLDGWLPLTIQAVALVLLIVAVVRLRRRWWFLWLPICIVLGVAAGLGAWAYMNNQGLASDPAPPLLWVAVGATIAALVVAIVGWPKASWWRRAVAILAVPATLLSAGVILNQWVGYYPTVQSAWSALTAGPLPHQTSMSALAGLRGTPMATGVVVPVDIPDTNSGFKHRTEDVYLPPAWFAGPTPPKLPVVMMIAGEFNTPGDWLRSGQIMPKIDAFTRANGGVAPILLFVDSSGAFNNDTECVDGPRGNAADHLTKDVEPYVESTFNASPDPANWAIIGWSMGGTCAVDMTVMHPELFHTFVDIAGDIAPDSGTKDQTIKRLFGGDAAKYAQFDPSTVMAAHGPYTGIAGLYDDLTPAKGQPGTSGGHGNKAPAADQVSEDRVGKGGSDVMDGNNEIGAAEKLCSEGKQVNIQCTIHTTTGGHTWQFAAAAFESSFPWVVARVGLPTPPTS